MSTEHARYFLANLSDSLRQDAYGDSELCANIGVKVITQTTFAETFRYERDAFFRVAQVAIDSGLPQRLDTDDLHPTTVRAVGGPQPHVLIVGGSCTLVARHFELASHDPGKRRRVLDRLLRAYSLPRADADRWRRICGIRPFTVDEFDAFKLDLTDTPDALRFKLEQAKRQNRVSLDELVPRSPRYYKRLVGIAGTSTLDPALLRSDIENAQRSVPRQSLIRSLSSFLATAASTSLLPVWVVKALQPDELMPALKKVSRLSDPYSLAAALELALSACDREPRAAKLAHDIGATLLGDQANLKARCQLFSALLMATSAGIAKNPDLRGLGPTWRRLAVFTHSAIAHRAMFRGDLDGARLLGAVASNLGTEFYVSALLDKAELPLWRPLWVMPDHVEANVIGRVSNALAHAPRLPAIVELNEIVATARQRIAEQLHPLAPMFPSFLEGYPSSKGRPAPPEVVQDLHQALAEKLPTAACAIAANVAAVADFPEDAVPPYAKAIARLALPVSTTDWIALLNSLSSAAHASAVARSVSLSDAIAETLFRALRQAQEDPPGIEVVTILFEASAAHQSRFEAQRWLGDRLRALAFIAPSGDVLAALVRLIDEQATLDPTCLTFFGQARAVAALAA